MKEIFKIKDMMKDVQTVDASAPLRDTLKKMFDSEFSQMPVMSDVGEVKDVISMESIVEHLFALNPRELARPTGEFMKKAIYAQVSEDIFDLLKKLAEKNFVLIKDGTQEPGIVTTYDFLTQFRKFADPFLVVYQIEKLLKRLFETCLSGEKFRQARDNALKEPEFQKIKSVNDLTFDNYKVILLNKSNRHYFKDYFGEADQEPLNRLMETARDVRNSICHFRSIASEADKIKLSELGDFLQRRIHYSGEKS